MALSSYLLLLFQNISAYSFASLGHIHLWVSVVSTVIGHLLFIYVYLLWGNVQGFSIFGNIYCWHCYLLFFRFKSFRYGHILYPLVLSWILLFQLKRFIILRLRQQRIFRLKLPWHHTCCFINSLGLDSKYCWHWFDFLLFFCQSCHRIPVLPKRILVWYRPQSFLQNTIQVLLCVLHDWNVWTC